MIFLWESESPSNPFMMLMFSSICWMLLIPERTVITPSRSAANLRAQDAGEDPGSAFSKISLTLSGGLASIPPLTGSMTMTGTLWLLATS